MPPSVRGCLGQQRLPWGERQTERDAGHLAQQLAPGTAMLARVAAVEICLQVRPHSFSPSYPQRLFLHP
jgi:hypothetical protein